MPIIVPQNKLGNTNITISKLGLGTVKFGRNTQVKYPSSFELPNLNQIIDLLELCKEYGINTLDTAPAYGDAEQKIGQIFKENNPINRSDWVLISKAGESFCNNQSSYDFSANSINNSLNSSLKNLNTDYLDILLIHSDGHDQAIANNDELWQLLEYRKKQGDIKAFGVSSKTVSGGLECLKKSDLAMITYRKDYQNETSLLNYALTYNKGIILKKVLNSGHISADNTATDCLQYAGSHPAVNSMIIGTINPEHLLNNIQAFLKN